MEDLHAQIYAGWWFQPTPLKNHGVRQLEFIFPAEWKNKKMFQTTNQICDPDYM